MSTQWHLDKSSASLGVLLFLYVPSLSCFLGKGRYYSRYRIGSMQDSATGYLVSQQMPDPQFPGIGYYSG